MDNKIKNLLMAKAEKEFGRGTELVDLSYNEFAAGTLINGKLLLNNNGLIKINFNIKNNKVDFFQVRYE